MIYYLPIKCRKTREQVKQTGNRPTRNTTYAASLTELSQQNEFKTRLIQPSLSCHGHWMHCLIIIRQISVCAKYDTICIEGLYMKCYKIRKIEKMLVFDIFVITFSGLPFPLVKNPRSRWFLNVFTVPLLITSWGRAFQVVVMLMGKKCCATDVLNRFTINFFRLFWVLSLKS